jgi:acetolactate synthase-1/3 small subunit
MSPSIVKTRTIIAHVEDKPGVLNRIASLFRRRGFNIASLTVGRTAQPGVSRLTIVVDADDDTTRRIEANLYKLVNVLLVEDVSFGPAIARELALIKVRATHETRPRVLQVCEVFGARVVDMTPELVTVELTSSSDKIDDLADVLRAEGVVDMVRTGVVAMTRGAPHVFVSNSSTETPETTDQEQEPWPESSTTATPISA